jgi:hypothetical protein
MPVHKTSQLAQRGGVQVQVADLSSRFHIRRETPAVPDCDRERPAPLECLPRDMATQIAGGAQQSK